MSLVDYRVDRRDNLHLHLSSKPMLPCLWFQSFCPCSTLKTEATVNRFAIGDSYCTVVWALVWNCLVSEQRLLLSCPLKLTVRNRIRHELPILPDATF